MARPVEITIIAVSQINSNALVAIAELGLIFFQRL